MIKVQHNQTGEIKEVSFPMWEETFAHEFWTVIEFTNMVVFYQTVDGKKSDGQIVDIDHAKRMVAKNTNIGYIPYSFEQYEVDFARRNGKRTKPFVFLNTPTVEIFFDEEFDTSQKAIDLEQGDNQKLFQQSKEKMELRSIDDVLAEFENSEILMIPETSLATTDRFVEKALKAGVIKKVNNGLYRLDELGFQIKDSGISYEAYNELLKPKVPEANLTGGIEITSIDELLKFMDNRSGIGVSKDTSNSEQKMIDKSERLGLIYKHSNHFYKLDKLGYLAIESGLDYDAFKQSLIVKPTHTVHIGNNISGNNNTAPVDVNTGAITQTTKTVVPEPESLKINWKFIITNVILPIVVGLIVVYLGFFFNWN